MTLRPEYSLGHSEYDAFLFAAVGEERVGTLTVLTALSRLGIDPSAGRPAVGLAAGNGGTDVRADDRQASRRRLEGIRRRGDRRPTGRFAAAAKRAAHSFNGGWTRQR